MSLGRIVRLWFGLSDLVTRRQYWVSGAVLMAVKYACDALLVYSVLGVVWSPLDYLNPLLTARQSAFLHAPSWVPLVLFLWTLPFMWIGASMSVRRAVDTGWSAWTGLLFFVPGVSYLMMLLLAVAPSRSRTTGRGEDVPAEEESQDENPWGTPASRAWNGAAPAPVVDDLLKSALLGVASGLILALAMLGVSVFFFEKYGASLFFGTPFVMGASSAFLFNRGHPRTAGATVLVGVASIAISGGMLLLFMLEGIVCLGMALPLAMGAAVLGALLGRAIALRGGASIAHLAGVALALPFLAGAESKTLEPPLREVISTVEVDAPPEAVWPNVIGFSDLPAPPRWFFRLGISYPLRARIEGRGAGAVRKCEFSTGPFVEPITRWEEPSRLSFDVRSQPPPMFEWSPYEHVNAPHLAGTLRSKKGEFRLSALGPDRTRIDASTWYELDMFPQSYWTLWSDALISAIHERVLEHVKALSEGAPGREATRPRPLGVADG